MAKRLVGFLTAFFVVCGAVVPAWAASYTHEDFPEFMIVQDYAPDELSVVLSYPCVTRINYYWNPVGLFSWYIGSNEPISIQSGSFQASSDSTGMQHFEFNWKSMRPGGLADGGISFGGSWISVEANYNLDSSGFPWGFYPLHISGGSGGDITTDDPWIDGGNQVKVLQPRDGFQQQGVKMVVCKLYYCVPFDGDVKKIKIKVDGYKDGSGKVTEHQFHAINGGTQAEGMVTVEGVVSQWNTEQTLSFSVMDHTGKVWVAPDIRVTCYEDFVDEDGDGLDDRTGQTEWTGGSGDPTDPRPGVDDGSGGINFDNITDLLHSLATGVLGFVGFLKEFFSFIPMPIFVVMSVSIGLIVLLRVFGR